MLNHRTAFAIFVLFVGAGLASAVELGLGSDLGSLLGVPILAFTSAFAVSFVCNPQKPVLAATFAALITGLAMLPNIFVLQKSYDHDQGLFRYFVNFYWGILLPIGVAIAFGAALIFSHLRRVWRDRTQ